MRMLMLALIAGLVSGCSLLCPDPKAELITQDLGCIAFRPIYPAKGDGQLISRTLKDQINAHNEMGERRCGWTPPGAGKEEPAK